MTIDEQIKILESNSEFERKEGDLQGCLNFKQLAEWLKDYKRLKEQEPCEDCISREKVSELLNEGWWKGIYPREAIMALPSVSPMPKMGRWIYDKNIDNWKCSECGETPKTMGYCGAVAFMAEHFKYCNHCGCKMQEVEE